jgi:hypothetical protein
MHMEESSESSDRFLYRSLPGKYNPEVDLPIPQVFFMKPVKVSCINVKIAL